MIFIDVEKKDKDCDFSFLEDDYIDYDILFFENKENKEVKKWTHTTLDIPNNLPFVDTLVVNTLCSLSDDKVFISNKASLEVLKSMPITSNLVSKDKEVIVYEDFYNWCKDKSKKDKSILKDFDRFEKVRKSLDSELFNTGHLSYMIEIYNILFLKLENEYKNECIKKIKYHLLDINACQDFNFLNKIDIDFEDEIICFHNKLKTHKIDFNSLVDLIKYKNLRFELEAYPTEILIQAFLLSLKNLHRYEVVVYTTGMNLEYLEYLKYRSGIQIEIIDVLNISKDDMIDLFDDEDI